MPIQVQAGRYDNVNRFGTAGGAYGNNVDWAANPDIAAQGAQEQANTRLAISPAQQAETDKMARFNQLFPYLTSQLGNIGGQFATAGGQAGPKTAIDVSPVWNPQQISQQVNATRATNDQAMQSQNRMQANQTAGAGFGTNSPLLQALQGQNFAANLGTNTQAEQTLRTTAAQQNASHVLAAQQAQEGQRSNMAREQIERTKPIYGLYGQLLGSLSGLV